MSSFELILEKVLILTSMNLLSLFVSLFLFVFLVYKYISMTLTGTQNPPPSPPKLPILGHLLKIGKHHHRGLRALSNQYGPLMMVYLGSKPAFIASSASVAKEILKTHDAVLSNRPHSAIYDKLLYNSQDVAFAPYGEYWRQMKSMFVLYLLSSKRVQAYRHIREEETTILIENVRKSSKSVNLSDLFSALANDVTCRVAFGGKYSGDQKRNVDFRDFLGEFNELLGIFNIGDFIPWMGWINRFNGLNAKINRVFKKFDMLIEEIIREHSERSNIPENWDNSKDFVDVLLEVQRENSLGISIERDSIKGVIVDAFAAGTHPPAAMLEWGMSELLRNPTIMDDLQIEVRSIVGDKQVITEEALQNMKYLKAVIKETLRLHPPTPLLIPHESTQNLKINGYDIAPKTMVIINTWAIQRDPNSWDEPEKFCPERFLNSTIDFKGQDFELIPFGAGRRICPAISFVEAYTELALANLVYKFNWSLPDGAAGHTLDMSEETGRSVRMKNPLLATAVPYTSQ